MFFNCKSRKKVIPLVQSPPRQVPFVDISRFWDNLRVTADYCAERLAQPHRDLASVLRSFNPIYRGKRYYKFNRLNIKDNDEYFDFCSECPAQNYSEIGWVTELMEPQLRFKREHLSHSQERYPSRGEIFVFDFETLWDGAAAAECGYLIDESNCPPIDSWIYFAEEGKETWLFAWIPESLIAAVNDAIIVNPEQCIHWLFELAPDLYSLIKSIDPSYFVEERSDI